VSVKELTVPAQVFVRKYSEPRELNAVVLKLVPVTVGITIDDSVLWIAVQDVGDNCFGVVSNAYHTIVVLNEHDVAVNVRDMEASPWEFHEIIC
jgi:hypothetical protein